MLYLLILTTFAPTNAWVRIADFNRTFVGDPDVLIIGNQKAGTTSLSELFTNRLKVYVTSGGRKEPHFFDRRFTDDGFNRYIDGFKSMKARKGNDLLTLDATPAFFRTPLALERFVSLYSPASLRRKKFILSLREPVVRDYSWFMLNYRLCKRFVSQKCLLGSNKSSQDTFHEFVNRMYRNDSYLSDGFALLHLKRLLALIPRDQVFIVNFESLIGEQQADTLNRLFAFLGIPPIQIPHLPHSNSKKSNCGNKNCEDPRLEHILCSDIRFLNETYARANHGLIEFINNHPDRPISASIFPPFKERFPLVCIDDGRS